MWYLFTRVKGVTPKKTVSNLTIFSKIPKDSDTRLIMKLPKADDVRSVARSVPP